MPFRFPGEPPKEALSWFRAKGYKVGFDHRDVWREEHSHAFTVAKAMSLDVLTAIREEVDRALAEGRTFQEFKRDLMPTLARLGWWGRQEMEDPLTGERREVQLGSPRRLRTIYRTNLRTARAAGQWERIQRTKKTHPYLIYELGPSENHRPEHASWSGRILPADDPWWSVHYPPNGWGCKCRVRQVSRREAERKGGPHSAPKDGTVEWVNRRTGEVMQIPKGIDPGWDYNPGAERAEGAKRQLQEKTKAFNQAVGRPLSAARFFPEGQDAVFSTVKGVDQAGIERILSQIPAAEKQLEKVNRFLQQRPIKTLVVKQAEMGKGAAGSAIENAVAKFLGPTKLTMARQAYYSRHATRTNGFTSFAFEHVVVKAKSSDNLAKVNPADLQKAVEHAIERAAAATPLSDAREWSIRASLDRITDGLRPGLVSTLVHELGHQVHFYGGAPKRPEAMPSITVYGTTNALEWHAEHFTAWLFNREAVAAWREDVAEYFDNLLETAINSTQKRR